MEYSFVILGLFSLALEDNMPFLIVKVNINHLKLLLHLGIYTDRNFVDNFLKVVIYLALVANI